jgi:hypothetical protein
MERPRRIRAARCRYPSGARFVLGRPGFGLALARLARTIGQAFPRYCENLIGKLRVIHDPRHGDRPNHGRQRKYGVGFGRLCACEAITLRDDVDEVLKSLRCHATRLRIRSRQLTSHCYERTTTQGIVAILSREELLEMLQEGCITSLRCSLSRLDQDIHARSIGS